LERLTAMTVARTTMRLMAAMILRLASSRSHTSGAHSKAFRAGEVGLGAVVGESSDCHQRISLVGGVMVVRVRA
jgi:hypothetical protein